MAFRIHKEVERGEIDNTTRDVVRGRIWLAGREDPLELELRGNCHRDIAGCRLTFKNPEPETCVEVTQHLFTEQRGTVGDMTASRKVRVLEVPVEEMLRRKRAGLDWTEHWGNGVYLEWYSERNGRVVIETTAYETHVSEPEWSLSADEDARVATRSVDTFCHWLDRVEADADTRVGGFTLPEDRPMNEFEWEQFMRESDAKAERFREVLEKYMDDPKRDRLIAEHMGWKWIGEALDEAGVDSVDEALAKADQVQSGETEEDDESFSISDEFWEELEDKPPLEPNPLTEGQDWVKDENGRICHPLYKEGSELSHRIFDAARAAGLLEDSGDEDVREMVFQMQCATAKLAGALNSLAYDIGHDPGFVIAYLKRSLPMIKDALNAQQRVAEKGLLADRIEEFRNGLFAVRSGIVDLIADFRMRQQ